MEVLALGLSRSATNSLKEALLILGYKDCFHGYDLVYKPLEASRWVELIRRKYYPTTSIWSPYRRSEREEEALITAEEFDSVLGHCGAVTDSPVALFAYDLIQAYPEAKVILNKRKDLDRWKASMMETLVAGGETWMVWTAAWFESELWWMYHPYHSLIFPTIYGSMYSGGTFGDAMQGKGKWMNLQHSAMVRGAAQRDNLLEWTVEDGWEPLCRFLGTEVPDAPFPRTNAKEELEATSMALVKRRFVKAARNMAICVAVVVAIIAVVILAVRH